jgi:hypothetical protein
MIPIVRLLVDRSGAGALVALTWHLNVFLWTLLTLFMKVTNQRILESSVDTNKLRSHYLILYQAQRNLVAIFSLLYVILHMRWIERLLLARNSVRVAFGGSAVTNCWCQDPTNSIKQKSN